MRIRATDNLLRLVSHGGYVRGCCGQWARDEGDCVCGHGSIRLTNAAVACPSPGELATASDWLVVSVFKVDDAPIGLRLLDFAWHACTRRAQIRVYSPVREFVFVFALPSAGDIPDHQEKKDSESVEGANATTARNILKFESPCCCFALRTVTRILP